MKWKHSNWDVIITFDDGARLSLGSVNGGYRTKKDAEEVVNKALQIEQVADAVVVKWKA